MSTKNKELPDQAAETTNPSAPKRKLVAKQQLTIPLISMAHLPLLLCEALSEPYQDEQIAVMGTDNKSIPTVIKIRDLDDNEVKLLVVNTIIASAFQRAIPPLTGRFFLLKGGTIREGKRYRDINVTEMELEA